MKINITKIAAVYDKKKDGTPLIDKAGKPYFRALIKTREHGEQILSGFLYEQPDHLEGTEVDWEVYEETWNEQKQLKFKVPSKGSELNRAIMRHEAEIAKLWEAVKILQNA